jgi:glycosyltransferase involved in cell wall biosynthesis
MGSEDQNPRISICIPVFNGAEFIRDCIESVLSQTFTDFELLIIDNASTDKTLEICFAFTDSRIRIHRNESNIGSHANFKKCFELARGKFVLALPSDDILDIRYLELLAPPLIANLDVSLAFGKTKQINIIGGLIALPQYLDFGLLDSRKVLELIAHNFSPIQHPLVRKSAYFKLGGFRLQYGGFMDIQLWSAIISSSSKTFVSSELTSGIRSHPNQGQAILADLDENSMGAIAVHFGEMTLKQYQHRFGLNLSYLRFVRFFIGLDKQYMAESGIDKIMLSKLIQSNLNALLLNLLRRKRSQLNFELLVARRVFGEFNRLITAQIYVREFLRIGIKELRNMTKRSSG